MKCREFQFHLDEYALGRIAPDVRLVMDAHRSGCQSCEAAYQQEIGLRSRLSAMSLDVPQQDLWYRVSAQIAQPAPVARPAWRKWTFAALVPAVSFAAMAFFLIPRQPARVVTPLPIPQLTPASYEEKVADNVLEMRRFEVAQRDGLMEQMNETLP